MTDTIFGTPARVQVQIEGVWRSLPLRIDQRTSRAYVDTEEVYGLIRQAELHSVPSWIKNHGGPLDFYGFDEGTIYPWRRGAWDRYGRPNRFALLGSPTYESLHKFAADYLNRAESFDVPAVLLATKELCCSYVREPDGSITLVASWQPVRADAFRAVPEKPDPERELHLSGSVSNMRLDSPVVVDKDGVPQGKLKSVTEWAIKAEAGELPTATVEVIVSEAEWEGK
jgi:hypothetical protein